MDKQFNPLEHLTESSDKAQRMWEDLISTLQEVGREDIILGNLNVLDLGGGQGEFSKNLNSQGIKCISFDRKDVPENPGANQIRGDAHQLLFPDESFSLVHAYGAFDRVYKPDFSKLIPEIARVLKPKGILAIQDYMPPPPVELSKKFKLLTNPSKDYKALWEKL